MRKLLYAVLMMLCLSGCTSNSGTETTTKASEITESLERVETVESMGETEIDTEETKSKESEVEESHNYREYIPIWENGVQSNLYDMLESKEIIYVRRYDCPDCAEYEESILRQIKETGLPYMILECSKTAPEWGDGPAIPSSVVKSIGIKEVPAVLFVMNGSFITRIENQFTQDGNEVQMTAESAFR